MAAAAETTPPVDAPSQTRTSARVRRPPQHFTSSPFANGSKRKRGQGTDADGDKDMGDADDASDSNDSDEDDDDEDEPGDEEIREKARKVRKAKRPAPKKPAAKKPKVDSLSLPFRAAKAPSKKRAPRRVALVLDSADAEAAGGLYAEIFAREDPAEQVVARWLKAFGEHESRALADVVNFVLKAAGCNGKVTEFDIEDPDGATAKLTDLQDEHQASEPTEYPLIAKGKNATIFKERVSGFMHTFIRSIAASDLLYKNPELIENIEVWLSTMSSAANRSFRHTSAVISLALISALCEIARELVEKSSNSQRHAETERKKARVNKARVTQIEESVKEANAKLEFLEALLKDWFDTVFIHRYRDIDPVIRRDAVAALGDWIVTMPDTFFDGNHLRYLGWVLCDISPATRGEDLKQLRRLYSDKDKLNGLKTFTERFRVRLVEIATADAEINVRIAGIDLLDLLRENGLLEPDDVDAVGRLIFHDEVRVRKAVAHFFAENVSDLYTSKLDDLGGKEALEEALPEVGEGNFSMPRLEWLSYKSLAELLHSYDIDDDGADDALPGQVVRNPNDGNLVLHATGVSSRFTLAADVLCEAVGDLKEWQALAGYLLVDDSTSRTNGAAAQSPLSQLKHECILSEKEVLILLEVLSASIRQTFIGLAEKITAPKSKLTQRQKDNLQDEQEEAMRNLVDLIPKLLKKFGDTSGTAAAVLRLEALTALPSFANLRQDSATSSVLLDLLSKQFMSHGTDEVLAPAADAILRVATSFGEADDVAAEKVSNLWDSIAVSLQELLGTSNLDKRGSQHADDLLAVGNDLLRIVRLGAVMTCVEALENNYVTTKARTASKEYPGVIDILIDLILRAVPAPKSGKSTLTPHDEELEDRIVVRAAEAALFYFRWKFLGIMSSITSNSRESIADETLMALAERRDAYANNLLRLLQVRKPSDPVSLSAAGCLLDLYSSSALLRTVQAPPGYSDDYTVLIMELDSSQEKAVMKVFTAAEKTFARLSHKKIDDATPTIEPTTNDIDADPASDDEDDDNNNPPPEDDDAAPNPDPNNPNISSQTRDAALAASLLAEQRLCTFASKLIYALAAGIISPTATRQRLELNKSRLGTTYKEVLAYLDATSRRPGAKNPATSTAPAKQSKPKPSSTSAAAPKSSRAPARRPHPISHALVIEDETDDEIEDVDEEADGQDQLPDAADDDPEPEVDEDADDSPAAADQDPIDDDEAPDNNKNDDDDDADSSVLGD